MKVGRISVKLKTDKKKVITPYFRSYFEGKILFKIPFEDL